MKFLNKKQSKTFIVPTTISALIILLFLSSNWLFEIYGVHCTTSLVAIIAPTILVILLLHLYLYNSTRTRIKKLKNILSGNELDSNEVKELKEDDDLGLLVDYFLQISSQLHRRIEMEQIVANISRSLGTAQDNEFQSVLNDSVIQFGQQIHSDHVSVLVLNENKTAVRVLGQWNATGYTEKDSIVESIPISNFSWILKELREKGRITLDSNSIVPADAHHELSLWLTESALQKFSVTLQPLLTKGELTGFICNKSHSSENLKDDSELQFLEMFAEITASSIERLRTSQLIKVQNQQLFQAQKMETVGNLAGGIAHDFNNILAGIVSVSSLFRTEHRHDNFISQQDFLPFLDTIQEAGNRAAKVVQQLLLLSRKQEFHFTTVDINRLINQATEMAVTSFDKSITITRNLCEGKALTHADAVQIEQVILNLMMNSVHAMTLMRHPDEIQGGELTITTRSLIVDKEFQKLHPAAFEKEYWVISIQDTGVGIPEKNFAKIFDPFFTTKEKGVGTGLGLSMIYRIVQEHYGFVEFKTKVGAGTSFVIYLPQEISDAEETVTVPVPVIENENVKKATILVVDDEPVLRKIAARILNAAGHTVLIAEDGGEAVDIYETEHSHIDLVILDLVMPVMGGRETYFELMKIDQTIPVIISSGFRKDERVDELLEHGATGFLQKPYTVEQMQSLITSVINNHNVKD